MDALEQLKGLELQLKYCNDILNTNVNKWEFTEYSKLAEMYKRQILELKKHIAKHPDIFNKLKK